MVREAAKSGDDTRALPPPLQRQVSIVPLLRPGGSPPASSPGTRLRPSTLRSRRMTLSLADRPEGSGGTSAPSDQPSRHDGGGIPCYCRPRRNGGRASGSPPFSTTCWPNVRDVIPLISHHVIPLVQTISMPTDDYLLCSWW